MTKEKLDVALEKISMAILQIVTDYTEAALLINACSIASDRYYQMKHPIQLMTTANIPQELRLDFEMDMVYSKEELVEVYNNQSRIIIFKNYIISIVSTVDLILEELYEFFYSELHPEVKPLELEKIVRNAWTNDSLLKFLSNPNGLNLIRPSGLEMSLEEAFLRYYELRILRHTLLHSNSALSAKNIKKLEEYRDKTPKERIQFALINSPVFSNGKVVLDMSKILSIRQFLDRFLMFIFKAIQEKSAA